MKKAWLAFWAVILAAIITGIFTLLPEKKKPEIDNSIAKTITQTANDSAKIVVGDDIHAGRDVYKAAGDLTVTTNQPVTVKKEAPIYIDESVTSNNAGPGSITARTVVVPPQNEVDIVDNYVLKYGTENKLFWIEFSPKQGKWESPFIAVLAYPGVDQDINMTDPYMGSDGITNNLDSVYVIRPLEPTTAFLPFRIFFKKLPSSFTFGDRGNPKKIYHLNTQDLK